MKLPTWRSGKVKIASSESKTALVDETNDPGSRVHGSKYIIGATVLKDSNARAFEEITEKRFYDKEFKFRRSSPRTRKKVLREISVLDPHVYAVTIRKPLFKKWTSGEKRNVNLRGYEKLTNRIAKKEEANSFHIIFDQSEIVDEMTIRTVVEKVSKDHGKKITFETADSKTSFLIQTNDYVIGALGKKYNRGEKSYIKILGVKVDRKRLIFKKTKSLKKK